MKYGRQAVSAADASARETIGRVAAYAIAGQLARFGVEIVAYVQGRRHH